MHVYSLYMTTCHVPDIITQNLMFSVSAQLTLTAVYNSQDASVEISGHCSSMYMTPVNVAIIIDASNGNRSQVQITCSNERFQRLIESVGCDYDIKLCGYYIFMNGFTFNDCPLNCSNPVFISCLTTPTTAPHPGPPLAGMLYVL